jgi:cellulose synthase/poly-beta-1,6-N-acetylglucosamine synthase-like glycosyltransferase
MKLAFWLSAFVVAYVYVGYPLLIAAWAGLRRPGPARVEGERLPGVSVLLAVRDEAGRLPSRLENLLALDYPPDRLEVIVVSNGSRDATLGVLDQLAGRVMAFAIPAGGKAGALNVAAAAASGEILVFADARQQFAADAVRRLVEPFADPRVGAVSGELILDTESAAGPADEDAASSTVGEGVGLYWRYEKWLRRRESDVHSMLGATGAIYAMRRSLWRPLPPDTLLDDVLAPMRAVLAGRRVVFAPKARAFDRASRDAATEERRKRRTLAGNYQLLWLEPRLLVPGLNPVWLQFVSHKVGRLLVPYALLGLAVSSAALAPTGAVYGLALAVQVAFWLLAAHGALIASDGQPHAARPAPTRKEVAHAQAD